jgi:hypothetical protein
MDAIVQARVAISAFDADTRDYLTMVSEIQVASDGDQEFAAEGLRWVKDQYNRAEAVRRSLTDPLNGVIRTINDMFRPAREACLDAERKVKGRIAGYLEEKDRRNQAALAAASAAPTAEAATEALQKVQAFAPPRGVSVRYAWRFEVTDESAVPREYLCPDLQKIGRAVQESRGEIKIPGVRAFQEPIVTSRPR